MQVRAMSTVEKFAFLGAVALASLLVVQVLNDGFVRETPTQIDSEPVAVESADVETAEFATLLSLAPVPAPFGYLPSLTACKGMAPSFGPNVDDDLNVTDFKPFVMAGTVKLAAAPVESACLSSSFGPRNGSLHKGLDFFNRDAVPVYAAADGVVRRQRFRNDYGNMIVIDHGSGVFTRYAHLEAFENTQEGDTVKAGQPLGLMGNTAGYAIPRHLHYEVLTGEWGFQAGSFALEPVDVMALPAALD